MTRQYNGDPDYECCDLAVGKVPLLAVLYSENCHFTSMTLCFVETKC